MYNVITRVQRRVLRNLFPGKFMKEMLLHIIKFNVNNIVRNGREKYFENFLYHHHHYTVFYMFWIKIRKNNTF